MAWIEVHQSLPSHRKTFALAELLKLRPAVVMGHLVALWLWALDNTMDGRLGGVSARALARAGLWEADPALFADALVEAGFLELVEGEYRIHDWQDYAGRLIEQRLANAERQRRYRASRNGYVTGTTPLRDALRNGTQYPTVPDSTRPGIHLRGESADSPDEKPSRPAQTGGVERREGGGTTPHAEQFLVLARVCGYDLEHLTRPARSEINAAAKHLDEAKFDGAMIEAAALAYRREMPECEMTPSALVKHASRLRTDGRRGRETPGREPRPTNKRPRSVSELTDEELARGVRRDAGDA